MNKINILGLGPGNKDYILPVTLKKIQNSDVIIGAKRNIDSLNFVNKEVIILKSNLDEIINYINKNKSNKKISIVVSGDTGFYSLLRFVKKHVPLEELTIIPGISSMQYLFAKIGHTYEDAHLTSLHGRNNDFIQKVKEYDLVGILTDNVWTPASIAKSLVKNNIINKYIYVGEKLSYEDEKITKMTIEEATKYETDNINIVIISTQN